jgi:hypothetical protein
MEEVARLIWIQGIGPDHMTIIEQCPSAYCDLPKGHDGFHSTQTSREQCEDYFEVVMHEYSLKCDRPRGHSGSHSCVEMSDENTWRESKRKIKIIAEWGEDV